LNKKRLLTIGLVTLVAVLLTSAVLAVIVTYCLDKQIPAEVTVTQAPPPCTQVTLYTDLPCTIEYGPINFGSIETGGSPVTKVLYFKANRSTLVPGGYGFGEINPASIVVTSNIDPAVATLMSIVGEPFGAVINGNHPCMLTLSVMPVGAGASNFNIHVTGSSN
jgi:hypothetical protein